MSEVWQSNLNIYKRDGEHDMNSRLITEDTKWNVTSNDAFLEDRNSVLSLLNELESDKLYIPMEAAKVRAALEEIISRNIPTVFVIADISVPFSAKWKFVDVYNQYDNKVRINNNEWPDKWSTYEIVKVDGREKILKTDVDSKKSYVTIADIRSIRLDDYKVELSDERTTDYLKRIFLKNVSELEAKWINVKLISWRWDDALLLGDIFWEFGINNRIPNMRGKSPMMLPVIPSISQKGKLQTLWNWLILKPQANQNFSSPQHLVDAVIGVVWDPDPESGNDAFDKKIVSKRNAVNISTKVWNAKQMVSIWSMVILNDAETPRTNSPSVYRKKTILIHKTRVTDEQLILDGAKNARHAFSITQSGLIVQNFPWNEWAWWLSNILINGDTDTPEWAIGVNFGVGRTAKINYKQGIAFRKLQKLLNEESKKKNLTFLQTVTHGQAVWYWIWDNSRQRTVSIRNRVWEARVLDVDGNSANDQPYEFKVTAFRTFENEIALLGVDDVSMLWEWEDFAFNSGNIDKTFESWMARYWQIQREIIEMELKGDLSQVRASQEYAEKTLNLYILANKVLIPCYVWKLIRSAVSRDNNWSEIAWLMIPWRRWDDLDLVETEDDLPDLDKQNLNTIKGRLEYTDDWELIMDEKFYKNVQPIIEAIYKWQSQWIIASKHKNILWKFWKVYIDYTNMRWSVKNGITD